MPRSSALSRVGAFVIVLSFAVGLLAPLASAATWSSIYTLNTEQDSWYRADICRAGQYFYAYAWSDTDDEALVWRSANGATWAQVKSWTSVTDGWGSIAAWSHNANTDYVLVTHGVKVYRSTDNGTTFAALTNLPTGLTHGRVHTNASWTNSAPDGDIYIAGYNTSSSSNYCMIRSHDNGTTWTATASLGVGSSHTPDVFRVGSKLYYVYSDGNTDQKAIRSMNSTDWGASWGSYSTINGATTAKTDTILGNAQYLDAKTAFIIYNEYVSGQPTQGNLTYGRVNLTTMTFTVVEYLTGATYYPYLGGGGIVYDDDRVILCWDKRVGAGSYTNPSVSMSNDTGLSIDAPDILDDLDIDDWFAGQAYSSNITCTIPDDGDTDWTLTTNATWLTMTDGGDGELFALLTGTAAAGSWYVNLSVADDGSIAYRNWTLSVGGSSPAVVGTPASSGYYGLDYTFNATSPVPDSGESTWNLTTNATWLSIESDSDTTCNLTGTPAEEDIGSYWANLTVFDMDSNDSLNWTIAVTDTPPMAWTTAPVIICDRDLVYEYDAGFDQDDETGAVFACATNATWSAFDNDTGILSGTPSSSGHWWFNLTGSCPPFDNISKNFTLSAVDDFFLATDLIDMHSFNNNIVQWGNRIYVVYGGPGNDPYIKVYDGSAWSASVKVGESPSPSDGHPAPTLCRDSDGYLHIAMFRAETDLVHWRSVTPDNTSAWTESTIPGSGESYGQLWNNPSNATIYLVSSNVQDNTIRFRHSLDGGVAWGTMRVIADLGDNVYTPATAPSIEEENGHYILVLNWVNSSGVRLEFYSMRLNLTSYLITTTGGVGYGTNVDDVEVAAFKVYEPPTSTTTYWGTMGKAPDGTPVAVFSSNNSYHSLEWNGTDWTYECNITTGTYYWGAGLSFVIDGALTAMLVNTTAGYDAGPLELYGYSTTTHTWTLQGTLLNVTQSGDLGWQWPTTGVNCVAGRMANLWTFLERRLSDPFGMVIAGETVDGNINIIRDGTDISGDWAPSITTTGNASVEYLEYLSYDAATNESTGGRPVFSMATNATFLSIDSVTGIISGAVDEYGSWWVNLSATSIFGLLAAHQNYSFGTNGPYIENAPTNTTAIYGFTWTWTANATPGSLGGLTWVLNAEGSGLSITGGGDGYDYATISGVVTTAGTHWVNITVSDDDSSDWLNFSLTMPDPPWITSSVPGNATEDAPWWYLIVTSQMSTLALVSNATWVTFVGGNISGTPDNLDAELSYAFSVTSSNANGTVTQNFTVFVYNQAPVFLSNPFVDGWLNISYGYEATTDDEALGVTYSLSTSYAGIYSWNATTGTLSFMPTVAGSYWFNLTADDNRGAANSTVYQNWTVTISAQTVIADFSVSVGVILSLVLGFGLLVLGFVIKEPIFTVLSGIVWFFSALAVYSAINTGWAILSIGIGMTALVLGGLTYAEDKKP